MPRKPRIHYPGALCHFIICENDRQDIFVDDTDRYRFYLLVQEGIERFGHLFQGRYNAILVDADTYLLELTAYIHLNPVRAGMVGAPETYCWSSHRA
ncbi:MAG: hypothetical protein RBR22_11575 [Desulfuromonas sp.]|nr:hypothetical protein [Desulfuromonas sp.]